MSRIAILISTKAVFETEVFSAENNGIGPVQYAHLPCLLMLVKVLAEASLSFSRLDALFSFREICSGLPALRALMAVVWPAVLSQLVGDICFRFALVDIAASIFATVRNLRIPLSAILRSSCLNLGDGYTLRQWLALLCIVLCASLATLAFQLQEETRLTRSMAVGLCFTIGSVFASTSRAVLEETFMKKRKLEPLQMKSAMGILLAGFAAALMFVADATALEPFALTVRMVRSSSVLRWTILFYFVACVSSAYMMVMITAKYDSCTKMLVDALAVCGTLGGEVALGHFTSGRRGIVLHLPFSVMCVTGVFLTAAFSVYYSTLPKPTEVQPNEKTRLVSGSTKTSPIKG